MSYLRKTSLPLRMIAWSLRMSIATLSGWDKLFDSSLVPYKRPEKRGRSGKVTIETVRSVVNKAKEMHSKGNRIRLKQFCRTLREDLKIDLGRKTIQEIYTHRQPGSEGHIFIVISATGSLMVC